MTGWQIMVRTERNPEEFRVLDYVQARNRIDAVERWRSTNPRQSQTLDELGISIFALCDAGGI